MEVEKLASLVFPATRSRRGETICCSREDCIRT
jgi:hypothetical protein